MNEIMRYDLDRDTDEGCADMIPISDGRYVEFEDFHRVSAERDGLQLSLTTADQTIDDPSMLEAYHDMLVVAPTYPRQQ